MTVSLMMMSVSVACDQMIVDCIISSLHWPDRNVLVLTAFVEKGV